ncbi:hypothetical protein HK100_006524 [Physocladia obscura]|uniref:Uncharacterized protein n=1 Tax=Physocladia obscura TaxID=109957 RepID=A0AAD5T565_9FUNG|nr:hypothetical protein HK100_006524 [Physocladia obscura]
MSDEVISSYAEEASLQPQTDKRKKVAKKPEGKRLCGIVWTTRLILIVVGVVVVLVIVLALIVVYVIAPKIAQSSLNSSNLNLSSSSITNATATSFTIVSAGNVTNAGSVNADISFPDPVTVSWIQPNGSDLPLGTITLSPISANGGFGNVSLDTLFLVTDAAAFGKFATYMIQGTVWVWRLTGSATVHALGITMNGLSLDKTITMAGFGGLTNAQVKGFDAGPAPGDEVAVNVTTGIFNPSEITIDMGDCFFDFVLGNGHGNMSASNVIITPGTNLLTLTGDILAPGNSSGLTFLQKFAAIVAPGNIVPVTVTGDHVISKSGGEVSWLNTAFKSLNLSVSMNLTDIAQTSITNADLTLNSSQIGSITEDTFVITGSGIASNAGFLDATLTFPDPVSVYWTTSSADVLLGTMNLSPLVVSGVSYPKSGAITINSPFNISNIVGMGNFSAALINGDDFIWTLKGGVVAESYGFSFSGLVLNKQIKMAAFAGLTKVGITAFDLPSSDPTTGIHIVTTSAIENPSEISISMGDVSFSLANNGTPIGFLGATDLTLVPGSNSVSMTGGLKVASVQVLSVIIANFLGGNGLNTTIVGSSSSLNASWLNYGLSQLVLNVDVPSPTLNQSIISGFTIPGMSVSMITADQTGMSVLLSAPEVDATFNLPYDFPITVLDVQQSLEFVNPQTGVAFATLESGTASATSDQSAHSIKTSISNAAFNAISGHETDFSTFFYALATSKEASVTIQGTATSTASTDAGTVQIPLPLSDTLIIPGFDGFKNLTVTDTRIVGGDSNGVQLAVDIILYNPSTVALNTGEEATFDLEYVTAAGSLKVGTATLPSPLNVVPGSNVITASAVLSADTTSALSVEVVSGIMAGFIAGESVNLNIVGTSSSISYTSLVPAFSALTIPATISGPSPAPVLVPSSKLYVNGTVLASGQLCKLSITLLNPFNADYTIYSIVGNITVPALNNYLIGSLDSQFPTGVLVPQGGSATTPIIPMIQTEAQITATIENVVTVISLANSGKFFVNAQQLLGLTVGTAPASLLYSATDINVSVTFVSG